MTAPRRIWWLGGLAIAMAVVVAASLLASSDPDGLERVAEDQGFLGRAVAAPFELLADYAVPGLDGPASTVIAGIVGVVVVFGLVVLAGRLLARNRSE
jgi:hypothetical protein